jgi:hypothetical protein
LRAVTAGLVVHATGVCGRFPCGDGRVKPHRR